MANYAGFAAVIEIRERTLEDILPIYYYSGKIPARFKDKYTKYFDIKRGIFRFKGDISIDYDLFLEKINVILKKNYGGRIAIEFNLTGRIELRYGTYPEQKKIKEYVTMTLRVLFRPKIEVKDAKKIKLGVYSQDSKVEELTMQPLNGSRLDNRLYVIINNQIVKEKFTDELQKALEELDSLAPPFSLPFFEEGGVIDKAVHLKKIVPGILDGILVIGIDVKAGKVPIDTLGTPGSFRNFLDESPYGTESDIAISLNPKMLDVITYLALPKIKEMVKEKLEVNLKNFSMKAVGNYIIIKGRAAKKLGRREIGKGDFILKVMPTLHKPAVYSTGGYDYDPLYDPWEDEDGVHYRTGPTLISPGKVGLFIKVVDVNISNIRATFWGALIATGACIISLTSPPSILQFIVSVIRILSGEGFLPKGMSLIDTGIDKNCWTFKLPDTNDPFKVSMKVIELETGVKGLNGWLLFGRLPLCGGSCLNGPTLISKDNMLDQLWKYEFKPGPTIYHPEDPGVRISWQIRRKDTNKVILRKTCTLGAPNPYYIYLDLSKGDLRNNIYGYTINCSVEKRENKQLFSDTITTDIDVPEWEKTPYVQWKHIVAVPQVKIYPDGTWMRKIIDIKRESKIHRTDPGKCLFADPWEHQLGSWRHSQLRTIFFRELPFPINKIDKHRYEICDYCFYGGPDKKKLKKLPAE